VSRSEESDFYPPISELQKTIDIFSGYDNFSLAILLLNFFPTKGIKAIEGQTTRSSFVQIVASSARHETEPIVISLLRQEDMRIKGLKSWSFGIAGMFILFFVSQALADKWSQRYIDSLPDSAFASIEITKDGKKIRHLPHHNHLGEIDIYHLKSALGRIHQVKWIDPANFTKAKDHLDQHYQVYKQERATARGLENPININEASISELMQLPHIGEKLATAIIEYRTTHGGFKTISELMHVPGIAKKILGDIEDLITVE